MIPENELKKYNWVIFDNGLERIEIQLMENKIGFDNECFYPIPVTLEILEKCGFENKPNSSHSMFWRKGSLTIRHFPITGNLFAEINKENVEIKYLHQLQNIYFGLEMEELVVKRQTET